jgi:hypothetical protein
MMSALSAGCSRIGVIRRHRATIKGETNAQVSTWRVSAAC